MNEPVDLNRLRETLIRNQSHTESENTEIPASEKVYVSPDGKIVVGNDKNGERTLAEIPQTVFADSR